MINFIYGRAGSGKTSKVCEMASKSLSLGHRVFLIVPEQMAVDAEEKMTTLLGDAPSLNLEILNFRRLCNRIFREYGGLSYNYISNSGKKLMMWQTLTELNSLLSTPISVERSGVARMLSAVSEFKAYGITPHALETAAKQLEKDTERAELCKKLNDLSLIYAAYTGLVGQTMDDAADDLTKAAELLREHSLFGGADVYFDAFNGYTPQELAIIREIFRQAGSATVSLNLDNTPELSRDELFINQKDTAMQLKALAESANTEILETVLPDYRRTSHPELVYLEKHLWSLDLSAQGGYKTPTDRITFFECQSLFDECEAAAASILKKVHEGASWRDFTVVTRGLDRYDGILDVIFSKYGIPLFVSSRTDIKSKPLIKLILAALKLLKSNFRTADVISYIKTGLAGLDRDEITVLENYAETWAIRGAVRWSSEWEMNPNGYTADFTEECANTLVTVNELRERVMLPLSDFHGKLKAASNVRECCTALYSFLNALEIPKKLSEIAESKAKTEPAEAQELRQLWSILIDSMDELCTVLPELEANAEVFTELLTILFDETNIGKIPCTVDEVTAVDATLSRSEGKYVCLLGANEGIFPLAAQNDGLFSDTEREYLSSVGVKLSDDSEHTAANERFAFYRAVTSASCDVTVLWSRQDLSGHSMKPSLGVTRLLALFPEVRVRHYEDMPLTDRIWGRSNLPEFAAEAGGTELGEALRRYAADDKSLLARLERLSIPLCDDSEYLSKETTELIFGGDIALTQSRLESYVLCHFSYFCKHILKLEEKKPAGFDVADIGSFIHHILELFVATSEEKGGLSELTEADIDLMVETIITDYMTDICRITPNFTGSRLAGLFSRLRRSSRLLCKNIAAEFSQSSFRPAFFELPIEFPSPGKKTVSPFSVELEDGSKAYVYGIADRVDILEHEDKLYVRVVDYKTGSKSFSVKDVRMGFDMQMLLYLFSIWKNGSNPNCALEFAKNAEILPAGVLYFKAGVPTVTLAAELPPEEVEQTVSDMLTRNGLLLNDMTVLSAMDKDFSGKYVPVKLTKGGAPYKNDSLTTLEGFADLLGDIDRIIRGIGKEMKLGNAQASPICDKKHNACKYCGMKPVCRKNTVKGGN